MVRLQVKEGILLCRRTPWDERIFGYPCAEITEISAQNEVSAKCLLKEFEAWAASEKIQFAYGRVTPTQVNKKVFQNAGFYYGEASYKLTYEKVQSRTEYESLIRSGPEMQPADKDEIEEIRNILGSDFHFGRLHEDPWVDSAASAQRYRNWLTDLIAQKHDIFSYRVKRKVVGLHIQRTSGDNVDLVLTGLRRSHSVLCLTLWATVLKFNRDHGAKRLQTLISAANIPVVNLYMQFGFRFEAFLIGFHKRWIR